VSVNCGDEWDALPFLVRQTGGSGSFFSMVDITLTQGHIDRAKAIQKEPGIVSWTNNALDWSHMTTYASARQDATEDCFMKMGVGHRLISEAWGAPSAMLMCAGGFSFEGERAWMNRRIFCVDTAVVCHTMKQVYPTQHFLPAIPGQTFVMEANRLKKVEPRAPFLTVEPPESWPARGHDTSIAAQDFAPATGRRTLGEAGKRALEDGLTALAASLVGGDLFRALHSVQEDEVPGRALTFAFDLRDDERPLRYAYVANECRFVSTDAPNEQHLAGLRCWATDLGAVLAGELGPIALTFGRSSLWNLLPQRFHFDVFGALYGVSHPLRQPAAYLATYEKILAGIEGAPTIKAA
jgi:hypothetical protein